MCEIIEVFYSGLLVEYSNDIENKKEADIKINKFYKFAKIVKGRSVLQFPSFNTSQLLTNDIVSNLA